MKTGHDLTLSQHPNHKQFVSILIELTVWPASIPRNVNDSSQSNGFLHNRASAPVELSGTRHFAATDLAEVGKSCRKMAAEFPSSWVARATRPSRRATGPAKSSMPFLARTWQQATFRPAPLRSASRRPPQAGRLCYPSKATPGMEYPGHPPLHSYFFAFQRAIMAGEPWLWTLLSARMESVAASISSRGKTSVLA